VFAGRPEKDVLMITVRGNTVEFRFFRPHALMVFLVGDFNHWREDALPMSRKADGHWSARLRLQEGEFRFRYLADGQWFTDYGAFGVEEGPVGTNSVVRVGGLLVEQGGRKA
jgi:1,4-alpha-glucan branching enzyme